MLAIIGASGKIGTAALDALLSNSLLPPSEIIACTSSAAGSPTWQKLESKGVHVRHASFDDPASLEAALQGVSKLCLISTPRNDRDYANGPDGTGREGHHYAAIDAARRAHVKHICYVSLAFADPSVATVMRAHLRTEAALARLNDTAVTVVRAGLYTESWPLWLGFYDPAGDARGAVALNGDGKVSFVALADLGLGLALVLAAPSAQYASKTFYLVAPPDMAASMSDVAAVVAGARGRDVRVEIVSRDEYERFYIDEWKQDPGVVRFWSTSNEATTAGETLVHDATLANLLASRGVSFTPVADVVKEMVKSGSTFREG